MHLVIQIPCFNEESNLAEALRDLPREVPGFTKVEWLVIDDGSIDRTREVAASAGVDHIIRHTSNRGLAAAFMTGVEKALSMGADVIVNTDADNQYCGQDIPLLTQPICKGEADLVIGARPISSIAHFSPLKKALQRWGSAVVRSLSGVDVQDAPSGFRAFSREAAIKLHIFSRYTYTLETIIQAGRKNITVLSVPVRVNGETRPSRLMTSLFSYVGRSMMTLFRISILYRPLAFFFWMGILLFGSGFALGLRYILLLWLGEAGQHIQSLILAAVLMGMGFQTIVLGLAAELIAANRGLLEDIRTRMIKNSLRSGAENRNVPPKTS